MKILVGRSPWSLWLIVLTVLLGTATARAQTASQLYAQGVQAYEQGAIPLAKLRLQQTLKVDQNFRPATALLAKIAQEQQATAGAAFGPAPVTSKALDLMVVPVEFKDTSLQSAVEYLRQQIEKRSGGRAQANFVLNVPPGLASKKVTLQMNHVPVTALLQYLGNLAGVSFSVEKYAIVVTPAAGNPPPPTTGVPATDPPAATP